MYDIMLNKKDENEEIIGRNLIMLSETEGEELRVTEIVNIPIQTIRNSKSLLIKLITTWGLSG